MIKTFTFLTLVVSTIACNRDLLSSNAQSSQIPKNSMSSVSIERVTLIAREEKNPPPGELPRSDRPVGFANVFLHMENPENADAKLEIQQIEIKSVVFGNTYMASKASEKIMLHPLEIAENSFHLTNQDGFPGLGKVKAVVTYRVGDRIQVIESNPVAIERH